MTEVLFIFIIIDIAYIIYLILSEQKTTSAFCPGNTDDSVIQDEKNFAQQTSENNSLAGLEQAD